MSIREEARDMYCIEFQYTPGPQAPEISYQHDFNSVIMARSDSNDSNATHSSESISPPSPLQVFKMTVSDIFERANDATLAAQYALDNQYRNGTFVPLVITFEAVREAIHRARCRQREFPERMGVQDVLTNALHLVFSRHRVSAPLVSMILEEAAYQLLLHLKGFDVVQRCCLAIAVVLENIQAEMEQASIDTRLVPEKSRRRNACPHPGCDRAFNRAADLKRHRRTHLSDDEKKKYRCDYKKCLRYQEAFVRDDHFRDHLRNFHKEDLTRRNKQDDEDWWLTRAKSAVASGWWRCNKCLLTRVRIKQHGWVCPTCSTHCETQRRQFRESMMKVNDDGSFDQWSA
ncbi:hypothetical protein B0T20DRAFT_458802 [Sordaria brevicollis]|uniref:C2H2-type domain-containing protein n=1 Tax=Sordaria brevicollis TaxID=83679 RepID=A0AAE0UF07_SORBR|nr:hypothetical protein B0T20DRAFT_458802 [Sordaria brevicollis]